jgi:two-component system sensor histidine kinase TorS
MMSMLDLFSDSSREQLAKLSLANPKEEVAKLLHGLKGSSASMGLIALAKLCKELELALKASADNALELSEFQRLESYRQASIAALSQWLAAQND